MTNKPKKRKSTADKPPRSKLSPELEGLAPDPDISLLDVLQNAEDTMALQVGNKPSMKELVKSAKGGDDKSFLALIKIHTFIHPFDIKGNSTLITPSISADRNFYKQDWVQLKLESSMKDKDFEDAFWKAVFSRQNSTLYNISASELKRYISIRKTAWKENKVTIEDIEKELVAKNYIQEWQYEDIESLRRFLSRCGLSRLPGRPMGRKNRT